MPLGARKFLMAGRWSISPTAEKRLRNSSTRAIARPCCVKPRGSRRLRCRAGSEAWQEVCWALEAGRSEGYQGVARRRAWLRRLDLMATALRHRWIGWDDSGSCAFETPTGSAPSHQRRPRSRLAAQAGCVSDGTWLETLAAKGVDSRLRPANCGFTVAWSEVRRYRGPQPLKGVALVAWPVHRAGRGQHPQRHRRRCDLRAVGELREALAHAGHRSNGAPTSRDEGTYRTVVGAQGQAIVPILRPFLVIAVAGCLCRFCNKPIATGRRERLCAGNWSAIVCPWAPTTVRSVPSSRCRGATQPGA